MGKSDNSKILKDKELLNRLVKEVQKMVVGEEDTIKTIILCSAGAWVEDPIEYASFNLCINSRSGTGKDFVCGNTMKIFPNEMVERRKRVSPTTFTYWHNINIEPEWTWDGKICYLEDITQGVLDSPVFKIMASSHGGHSTIVKDQRAIDLEVKGKPVMIVTTATGEPVEELFRRFPMIQLDESEEQSTAIMKRKSEMAVSGKVVRLNKDIPNALMKMDRLRVIIPYATKFNEMEIFPKNIIVRTNYSRFLDYIKASAVLHQYQRKVKDYNVIAEPDDYEIARECFMKTCQNEFLIPLNQLEKKVVEHFKKLKHNTLMETHLTVKEFAVEFPDASESHLYKVFNGLKAKGYLKQDLEEREGVSKPVRTYKLVDVKAFRLPTKEEVFGGE